MILYHAVFVIFTISNLKFFSPLAYSKCISTVYTLFLALDVMGQVQDIRKSSLTFAPEAGSQRMRNVINKGLTVEDIIGGAGQAFDGGWNKVKLYFMLGLPTETEEDMRAIPELADQIARRYYEIPKDQRMENVRLQRVHHSSFQSRSHHSSGQECIRMKSTFPEQRS